MCKPREDVGRLHVDRRRGEHPDLHQKRNHVLEIAIGDVQGGQQSAHTERIKAAIGR